MNTIMNTGPLEYAKVLAWIVREGGRRKAIRDCELVASWREVGLAAFMFSKTVSDVAADVVEFARAINGEIEIGQS